MIWLRQTTKNPQLPTGADRFFLNLPLVIRIVSSMIVSCREGDSGFSFCEEEGETASICIVSASVDVDTEMVSVAGWVVGVFNAFEAALEDGTCGGASSCWPSCGWSEEELEVGEDGSCCGCAVGGGWRALSIFCRCYIQGKKLRCNFQNKLVEILSFRQIKSSSKDQYNQISDDGKVSLNSEQTL